MRRISARGKNPPSGFNPQWTREENFVGEAAGNRRNQRDDERFNPAEAPALQSENDQDIGAGEEDAVEQWNMKQELESNGGTEHLGEVASGDGNFAEHPKHNRSPA